MKTKLKPPKPLEVWREENGTFGGDYDWWARMPKGWKNEDGSHVFHEETRRAVIRSCRLARPCTCDECK